MASVNRKQYSRVLTIGRGVKSNFQIFLASENARRTDCDQRITRVQYTYNIILKTYLLQTKRSCEIYTQLYKYTNRTSAPRTNNGV